MKRKNTLHDLDPKRTRLFCSHMTDAERFAELWRLADLIKSEKPLDASARSSIIGALLEFSTCLTARKTGRPSAGKQVQLQTARCLVWLQANYRELKVKQRKAIVTSYLALAPSAVENLPPEMLVTAEATLPRWLQSPEAQRYTEDLGREAKKASLSLNRRSRRR